MPAPKYQHTPDTSIMGALSTYENISRCYVIEGQGFSICVVEKIKA